MNNDSIISVDWGRHVNLECGSLNDAMKVSDPEA